MNSTDAVPEGSPPPSADAPVPVNLTDTISEPGGDAEVGAQPLPVAELPPVRVIVQELMGTSYEVLARAAGGWVEADSASVLTGVPVQHDGRVGITKGSVKRNGQARKVQWSDNSSESWVVAERLHVFTHLAPTVGDLKAGIHEHLGGVLEPDAQRLETAGGEALDDDTMALSEVGVVDGSEVRLHLQAAETGREQREEREAARVVAVAKQQRAIEVARRVAACRVAALALPWVLLLLCGVVLHHANGWSLWRDRALWSLVGLPVAFLGALGFDYCVPAHSAAHWEDRPMTEEENLEAYRAAIDNNRRGNYREGDEDYIPPRRTGGTTNGQRGFLYASVGCYAFLGVVATLISLLFCPTKGTVFTTHGWYSTTALILCTNDCLYNPHYTGGCGRVGTWDGCVCSQADVELFYELDSGSDRDEGGDFTMEGISTGCLACILRHVSWDPQVREAEAAATCIWSVETAPELDDQQNNATTSAPPGYPPYYGRYKRPNFKSLRASCVCDSDEAAACGGCGITVGDCKEALLLQHSDGHSLL